MLICIFVFFFKQKTAYEMRISDWSSDVCSSDLWNVVRDDALGEKYREIYYDYLDAAYEYHYQNSFLAWYQNTDTLLVSSKSTNPDIRNIYDQTYLFIEGKYRPES